MIGPTVLSGRQGAAFRVLNWQLFRLPARVVVLLLGVEAVALAATGWALWNDPIDPAATWRVLAIAGVAVGYGEACDRVERLRRFLGDGMPHSNHLSVWTVAAMLVAPAGLACLLVILLYAHALLMAARHQSVRPHRSMFTAASAVLGTWIGSQLADLISPSATPGLGSVAALASVVAVAGLFAVNAGLVAAVVRMTSDRRGRDLLPPNEALWFEAGTQGLGVVGAQLLLHSPWLAPVTVPILVLLHRASLVKKLQIVSTIDQKTNLLNAGAWRERATAAVQRAAVSRDRVALIVIDLDHFKLVNDRYGHLLGDEVLRAVAALMKRQVRGSDLLGRFGGEEFMILISGPTAAAHAVDIATRLRSSIAALELPLGLQVTASLGIAHQVPDHADLDTLVAAADAALYEAKARGRDRVHAALVD